MTEIASSEAEVKVTSVVETAAAAVVAPTLIGLGVIVKTAVEAAFSEAEAIVRPVEAVAAVRLLLLPVMVSLRLLDFKQLVEETGTGGTLDLGGRGGGIFCCDRCCGCCC